MTVSISASHASSNFSCSGHSAISNPPRHGKVPLAWTLIEPLDDIIALSHTLPGDDCGKKH